MTESAPQPAAPLTEAEDKQWASFAHLGGVLVLFLGPLGFIPALIIWLVFKDRGAKTAVEAKEALNFQIAAGIIQAGLYILGAILSIVLIGVLFFFLVPVVVIAAVIFSILGFVKVNGGGSYRYPVTFRVIK